MPNDIKALLKDIVAMEPMRKHLLSTMLDDDKFFAEVLKIAASDDTSTQSAPTVDVKIVQFINAMTPEERSHYVKTGELPQATFTRVNAKLAEEGK